MFEFDELIGLDVLDAKKILQNFGFKDIEIILNSENNDKCDTQIVCAARYDEKTVKLICGEFFFGVEKE